MKFAFGLFALAFGLVLQTTAAHADEAPVQIPEETPVQAPTLKALNCVAKNSFGTVHYALNAETGRLELLTNEKEAKKVAEYTIANLAEREIVIQDVNEPKGFSYILSFAQELKAGPQKTTGFLIKWLAGSAPVLPVPPFAYYLGTVSCDLEL